MDECLRQFEKSLEIINPLPGNVYYLDRNLRAVGCNQNVLDMFGFKTSSEFKGLSFEEMGEIGNWEVQAQQSFKNDTQAVIETGIAKVNIEEPPIPHADGGFIYFLSTRVPLFDDLKRIIGVTGVSIDITEHKKAEQTSKLKTLHEFRDKLDLSNREAECVYHTVRGMSAKQIARIMGLSNRTVESYLNNAKFKLNCKTKQELIFKVFEKSWLNI